MADTSDPRGDEIVGGRTGPLTKRTKPRKSQWTKARRAKFLGRLAATCNVARSSRAAGVKLSSPYALRRRDAEFARLWQEAMATGYERLEAELLALALKGSEENAIALAEIEGTEPADAEPFDVKLALTLLGRRGGEDGAARSRVSVGRKRATREETDAAILKKLDSARQAQEAGFVSGTDPAAAMMLRLMALSPAERRRLVGGLTPPQALEFNERWANWAHDGQVEPPGDWTVWLIRAGRGFGKTRAGAEWVSEFVRRTEGASVALVGASGAEVPRVMVEGPSGLLAVAQDGEAPVWRATRGEVRWPNGATAFVYSADVPESLRGPEHHIAWCDELAKWRRGSAAWDNLLLTMRAGDRPRVVVTTTPRPNALMRRVMAAPGTVETLGRTRDNPHLPASFVEAMEGRYGGTRLGRQELGGEMVDDVAGALWTRAMLEACRVGMAPATTRVVVGVDPPAGIGRDACGIVAVGLGGDRVGYVLEDASVAGLGPEGWARAVAGCAERHGADRVVAEGNQGGAMVESVLRAAFDALPVRLVHASMGKGKRAEPVAALYERGRVRHAGVFPALEDELCGLTVGGGYEGPGRSPDRADALVWALTELMLGRRGGAAVRGV